MRINQLAILLGIFGWSSVSYCQTIYFPPSNNQTVWETQSPESLGWCTEKVDSLYQFLELNNSKAFLVLKNGRIVLERYFGTFTPDSAWYWASAGKTLTAFLVAKAKEEGSLSLDDITSQYLGQGWTSAPIGKEYLITLRHQMTMTSGLNDGVQDPHCTLPSCLQFLADAGTRWAYHNAPYTLLEKVLQSATGTNFNLYTQTRLKNQTGMTGLWVTSGFNNVYFSTARSMARFGLLAQNNFKWNNTTFLSDSQLVNQMTNTSQNLNESYGYLWWLNGKSTYRLPGSQFLFQGPLAPQAPPDLVAGMGKNGQIVAVSKNQGLVVVRMGNDPTGLAGEVPNVFLNDLWKNLNKVICNVTTISESHNFKPGSQMLPNPGSAGFYLMGDDLKEIQLFDLSQRFIQRTITSENTFYFPMEDQPPGMYLIKIWKNDGKVEMKRWIKSN